MHHNYHYIIQLYALNPPFFLSIYSHGISAKFTCLKCVAFCRLMVGDVGWSFLLRKLTALWMSDLDPSGLTVILMLCDLPIRFFTVDLSSLSSDLASEAWFVEFCENPRVNIISIPEIKMRDEKTGLNHSV